ncbi:ParB/RepB/Spo0J family partition protein [Streptomyces sp. RG80]|uniref:ParB/RepB/Spo0J family partition protein n=1 Tax=Streptomyces sp. RG80 TaxID=3157340 RepID=UPI00338ECCA6
MSKRDQLGSSASFSAAAGARSSRRTAIDKTIHGASSQSTTVNLTDLPVPQISNNPDNHRNHLRNLDETVASVNELGVILPIVVATVDAYLRDRPDRADDLDDGAQYVVVDGHRRLEAARRVGLATIPVRVDDARVSTDTALLETAFIANYHREGLTELEEAHALQQLVEYYGSQATASKRLGIAKATLSSKLSLLKLVPELQKDLMTGARTAEHVRNLGRLSPAAQKEKADQRAEEAKRKAKERHRPAGQVSGASGVHGVNNHETVTQPDVVTPAQPAPQSPAAEAGAEQTPEAIPEPRTSTQRGDTSPRQLPYDDAPFLAMHLHRKMEPAVFVQFANVVLGTLREQHPDAYRALLSELAQHEQRPV